MLIPPTPTWFVTGASAGLGKQIALEALSRGHKVIATSRSKASLEQLDKLGAHTLALDVTAPAATIDSVVAEVVAEHGPVTHLINAAGYGLEGVFEETAPEEVFRQYNTNVFGSTNVARALLPHLRERAAAAAGNRGIRPVIANFGSVGSWYGIAGMPHYAATKWAVTGLSLSMRDELEPLGITVTCIEPGYFRTSFLNPGRRVATARRIEAYEGTVGGDMHAYLESVDNKQLGDPAKGARVVVDILTGTGVAAGKAIPGRLILGSDTVNQIRAVAKENEALLAAWEDVARSTDHDDVVAAGSK